MESKPKRKRGRPRGSKAAPIIGRVVEVPTRCPRCQSEDTTVLRIDAVRNGVFNHPEHGVVNKIERSRMKCTCCNGVFIKHTLRLLQNIKASSDLLPESDDDK